MKVRFKDGTEHTCSAPTEQKLFKNGSPAGWLLSFSLEGAICSEDLDAVLAEGNVAEMTFLPDVAGALGIGVTGYNKVSSAVIRHAVDPANCRTDIQLTKGV